jgi:putative polyhydroxyalkanoate system protein
MPSIKMQRRLSMSNDEALLKVEEAADKLAEKYGLMINWLDDYASIRGPGVDGTIKVADSVMDLNLELGFLAAPFKSKIEAAIEEYFERLG